MEAREIARTLIDTRRDRMLWGTDWAHSGASPSRRNSHTAVCAHLQLQVISFSQLHSQTWRWEVDICLWRQEFDRLPAVEVRLLSGHGPLPAFARSITVCLSHARPPAAFLPRRSP